MWISKQNIKKAFGLLSLVGVTLIIGRCGTADVSGPVQLRVLQPVNGSCQHQVEPATVYTLQNIPEMRGDIGQVVYHEENIKSDPDILDFFKGFQSVSVDFLESGSSFTPLDINSLYAGSLYYAVETAYLLFRDLDPAGDLKQYMSDISQTRILHEGRNRLSSDGDEVTDNAQYLAHEVYDEAGTRRVNDFIISYPTEETPLPLGLNLGIMVHEYSHLAVRHFLRERFEARSAGFFQSMSEDSQWTLASLDEGLADYFGFLASENPTFFLCSYPESSNRDLRTQNESSLPNSFPGGTSYRQHYWGSVFANLQYQIGEKLIEQGVGNHFTHGGSIVRMLTKLSTCSNLTYRNNVPTITFSAVKECHLKEAQNSAHQTIMQQIYSDLGL